MNIYLKIYVAIYNKMFPPSVLVNYREIKHLTQALNSYVTLYENMINDRINKINNSSIISTTIITTFADSVKIFTDVIASETKKIIDIYSDNQEKDLNKKNVKTSACCGELLEHPIIGYYNNSSLSTDSAGEIHCMQTDERELNLTV